MYKSGKPTIWPKSCAIFPRLAVHGCADDRRRACQPLKGPQPMAARYAPYWSSCPVASPIGARRMWSGMANAAHSGTATPRTCSQRSGTDVQQVMGLLM